MIRKAGKRGDTLIEVMLAVGIFSMVAVAIVSVMSGGTSSSQTALETTLTREEIDNQAEALRFIQRAYLADTKTGKNSPYGGLWKHITSLAVNASGTYTNDSRVEQYSKFRPTDCNSLYDTNGEATSKGFIIDPNGFAGYEESYRNSPDFSKIVYRNSGLTGSALQPASTYPHIVYSKNGFATSAGDTELISDEDTATGTNSKFYRAEGIYIIAIKDPKGTSLANTNTASATDSSAYYDFYIRTCWYGAGDQAPSTISTVVRLYNPDLITDSTNL